MYSLTDRQCEVVTFIRKCVDEVGLPPTRSEIAREFGWKSANSAEEHLRAIARKGFIQLVPGISRGIKLIRPYV